MDPSEVDAHWRLARLYQAMGKKEEARAEFAKASALHQKKDESLVQKMTARTVSHRRLCWSQRCRTRAWVLLVMQRTA